MLVVGRHDREHFPKTHALHASKADVKCVPPFIESKFRLSHKQANSSLPSMDSPPHAISEPLRPVLSNSMMACLATARLSLSIVAAAAASNIVLPMLLLELEVLAAALLGSWMLPLPQLASPVLSHGTDGGPNTGTGNFVKAATAAGPSSCSTGADELASPVLAHSTDGGPDIGTGTFAEAATAAGPRSC